MLCEVEKIINWRKVKGRKEYLVKWVGYSSQENSWVPYEGLQCPGLLEKFRTGAKPKKTKKARGKASSAVSGQLIKKEKGKVQKSSKSKKQTSEEINNADANEHKVVAGTKSVTARFRTTRSGARKLQKKTPRLVKAHSSILKSPDRTDEARTSSRHKKVHFASGGSPKSTGFALPKLHVHRIKTAPESPINSSYKKRQRSLRQKRSPVLVPPGKPSTSTNVTIDIPEEIAFLKRVERTSDNAIKIEGYGNMKQQDFIVIKAECEGSVKDIKISYSTLEEFPELKSEFCVFFTDRHFRQS